MSVSAVHIRSVGAPTGYKIKLPSTMESLLNTASKLVLGLAGYGRAWVGVDVEYGVGTGTTLSATGGSWSMYKPKSDVEWAMERAAKTPGPGEYQPKPIKSGGTASFGNFTYMVLDTSCTKVGILLSITVA